MSFILQKSKYLIIRIIAPAILDCVFSFYPRKKKTLLIIKNDGIGDYILFRNYIEFLRCSQKYKYYKIYLLTNPANRDLAIFLDSEYIDGFFWYEDGYFLTWKLIKLISDLQKLRLQTIIYPNYSRKFSVDWLVNHIKATEKITVEGDTINQSPLFKKKGNKYYSEILKLNPAKLHEFDRNKQITEVITEQQCDYIKPFINLEKLNVKANQSVVIFSGGSEHTKKWSSLNYNRLCHLISSGLNLKIILAGGKDDIEDGKVIQTGLKEPEVQNKIGKFKLIELYELIAGAKLLVSNDTLSIHIAASLNIPAICIAKGDLYGRFIPYPPHISNSIFCVFPQNFIADSKNYDQWSSYNINDVLVEDVYRATANALTTSK